MTNPRLVVFTILSVIAYLALAVAGAGGAGRFFSYPPLIAIGLVTIALGIVSLFSEGHIGSGVKEDRSNRWVIAALGVLGLLGAYLPAYTDRIDFLTFGGEVAPGESRKEIAEHCWDAVARGVSSVIAGHGEQKVLHHSTPDDDDPHEADEHEEPDPVHEAA